MAEINKNSTTTTNNGSSNANARFSNAVNSLVNGLDSFLCAKTVLGEPVQIGDTTIMPLSDISFGVGAGAFGSKPDSGNAGGGVHGKMTPTAILVVKDGIAKVVNIKDQDALTKIFNMAPDVMDKVSSFMKKKGNEPDEDYEEEYRRSRRESGN